MNYSRAFAFEIFDGHRIRLNNRAFSRMKKYSIVTSFTVSFFRDILDVLVLHSLLLILLYNKNFYLVLIIKHNETTYQETRHSLNFLKCNLTPTDKERETINI